MGLMVRGSQTFVFIHEACTEILKADLRTDLHIYTHFLCASNRRPTKTQQENLHRVGLLFTIKLDFFPLTIL